ncbi:unnamed protein product [Wuchereria bancrofti]|uniref:Uncharacterized protein n=1 Tax=Wuchereria bancrofti TaxID=6293 RepID=A0A3P7DUX7_WUCBA|nr:unnamed protein product [Wuchereria bancrofti]
MDISLTDVPMFDRPPVNVLLVKLRKKKEENLFSIRAYTKEGSEYNEVGFMTGKPFRELTGFQEFNKSLNGNDQIAIEMSRRSFKLKNSNVLVEKTYMEYSNGTTQKWIKRYRRTKDYLMEY